MIASRTFIKNFAPAWPTDGSAADMEAKIQGLDKTTEILALEAEVVATGKSTATAFNWHEKDGDTVVGNIVKTVRHSFNTETDNCNLSPDRLRDIADYAFTQDPYQRYKVSQIGQAIPATGGTAVAFPFVVQIPFINIQKENPNQNALSGAQLNRDGRVNLDAAGVTLASLNALVLINGTINISAVSIKLYALTGRKRKKGFVAPTQYWRFRNQPNNPDVEIGPFYDELVFETRDPATLDGVIANLTIEVDSVTIVRSGTTATQLAAGYTATTKPQTSAAGGNLAYDITNNNRHSAFVSGNPTGRSPLQWVPGSTQPDESEVPVVNSARSIFYSTAANGTIVYWRIAPIDNPKTRDAVAGVINENPEFREAAGLTLDQLAVKGGGSSGPGAMNGSLRRYKPVWLGAQAGV